MNHVHALGIGIPATAASSILDHVHALGIAITGTAARGSPYDVGDTVRYRQHREPKLAWGGVAGQEEVHVEKLRERFF